MSETYEGSTSVIGTVAIPPDPSIARAIGGHHSLATALADLIDNSIDADASEVRIRFVENESGIVALRISDNGTGMSATSLLDAMTIGKRREYRAGSLGHFGMGLKAASLSQADSLSVWSSTGDEFAGMRLKRDAYASTSEGEYIATVDAESLFTSPNTTTGAFSGTVVQWNELRNLSRAADRMDRTAWLSHTVNDLCLQLGVTFHQLIEDGEITISIDIFDLDHSRPGILRSVDPIDPFAFRSSGAPGYPLMMKAVDSASGIRVPLEVHILPAKSESASAKLFGKARSESQGFYVYRNKRLLQAGGWNAVTTPRADLQLARVRIDIDDAWDSLLRINAEKHGVEFLPSLSSAIDKATSTEPAITFGEYLKEAQSVLKTAQKRRSELQPVAPIGKGFHPRIRSFITKSVPVDSSREPVNIRWKSFPNNDFFALELASSTIWLNQKYRKRLTGKDRAGMNDAPIVKTALFLLLQHLFAKQWLQSTTKEQLEVWQAAFNLAADVELDIWEDGD